MRDLIRKVQSYWLADASFVTLLIILIAAVFVLPVIMEISGHGVLLFNILLLSVFFSGIFSTRSAWLISVSAVLFEPADREHYTTVRRCLPLALRRLITACPCLVDILLRKPWVLARLRRLG